jgi:hypothetical protein
MASVIHNSPVGWWFSYKKDEWCGPFKDLDELIENANYLVPTAYKTFTVLQVAPWETKTFSTKTMKEKT